MLRAHFLNYTYNIYTVLGMFNRDRLSRRAHDLISLVR